MLYLPSGREVNILSEDDQDQQNCGQNLQHLQQILIKRGLSISSQETDAIKQYKTVYENVKGLKIYFY